MEQDGIWARYAMLTPRQRDVLALRCQGVSNQGVARHLFVQEKTIKNRMTAILARMGQRGRRGSAALCAPLSADEAGRSG